MKLFDINIGHIIPARLGYSVLLSSEASTDCPVGVQKRAVVAWAIEADTYVPHPITMDGLQASYEAIECPDGQVACKARAEWSANAVVWRAELGDHATEKRGTLAASVANGL